MSARRLDPGACSVEDQVISVLRDSLEPLTSTQIGKLVPYVDVMGCPRDSSGVMQCGRYCPDDEPLEIAGAVVHVWRRVLAGSGIAQWTLDRLERAGRVERAKVGRRWLYSLTTAERTHSDDLADVASELLDSIETQA